MYAVNPELCTFCKKCLDECPTESIYETKVGDKDVCAVKDSCIDCGACEDACEHDALTFQE